MKNSLFYKKKSFRFEILHESRISRARVGKIYTPHGIIDTPTFVPVATTGTVKAVDPKMTRELGIHLLFCNTYHLLVHPGLEAIAKAEGLHSFMNYQYPIITDSGGFQVFSLAQEPDKLANELKGNSPKKTEPSLVQVTEEGVVFRSYLGGEKIMLSPESSVRAQKVFGSDIIIPLDILPPYHTTRANLEDSLERTHRWELRSLNAHLSNPSNQGNQLFFFFK